MNTSNQRRDFRLLIHESEGQAYENLFVKIMQYANRNFVPIKPHGSDGDRKNDGYDPVVGAYFQVYAPENAQKNPYNVIKKLVKDFEGLYSHWKDYGSINEFYFVINDKYKGTYPKVNTRLTKIKTRYGLLKCEPFLAQHLESTLFNLSQSIIDAILTSHQKYPTPLAPQINRSPLTDKEKETIPLTSDHHIDSLVYELIQKIQHRPAEPSDLFVYSPIIAKYGMKKGKLIVERSLRASVRGSK